MKTKNILIAEPSCIIYEGIVSILSALEENYRFIRVDDLSGIREIGQKEKIDLVLLDLSMIQYRLKLFSSLKKGFPGTKWAGIINGLFDQHITGLMDDVIYIHDSSGQIIEKIGKLVRKDKQPEAVQTTELLSDRETEVLKLLIAGNSNREIAEKLFISIHTVITHRKNISQKTGIKSVSGLTIFAVLNKIVALDQSGE